MNEKMIAKTSVFFALLFHLYLTLRPDAIETLEGIGRRPKGARSRLLDGRNTGASAIGSFAGASGSAGRAGATPWKRAKRTPHLGHSTEPGALWLPHFGQLGSTASDTARSLPLEGPPRLAVKTVNTVRFFSWYEAAEVK